MEAERADLFGVAVCATVATLVVLIDAFPTALQVLAGVPLVLLLPGYAVSRALFGELRGGAAEATALSLALSVAVTIACGLLWNLTPWSLSDGSWPLLLLAATLAACRLAQRRSPGQAAEEIAWREPRTRDLALLAVAALVAIGAIVLGREPLSPPEGVRGYTELSQVRQGKAIQLRVTAHELTPARYRLDLRADGRLLRRWRTGRLEPGQGWRATVPLSSARRARQVEARLYRPSSPRPYRRVRLELRRPTA